MVDDPLRPLVVGLGWAFLDGLMTVERYPVENTKEVATAALHQAGGPVVRAMAVASSLGLRAALICALGEDSEAERLLREVRSFGIDTSNVQVVSEKRTRLSQAWLSKSTGSRTNVYVDEGPSLDSLPSGAEDLVLSAAVLHLDGREPEIAKAAARMASDRGIAVTLDAGSPKEDLPILLGLADIAIVPDHTMRQFYGQKFSEKAVQDIFDETNLKRLIITAGKEGSTGFDRDGTEHFQPVYGVEVVDSNGAGDVFAGGVVWGTANGLGLAECLRVGSACAAIKCRTLGNKGMPTLSEVEELVASRG